MADNRKLFLLAMRWYESRIHLGVMEYAREHDIDLIADDHHMGIPHDEAYDGVILSACSSEKYLSLPQSFQVPIVLVSENGLGLELPCVMPDYVAIGRLAADFFAARGFKHFTYIDDHAERMPWHNKRMEGFRTGVEDAGGMFSCLQNPVRHTSGITDYRQIQVRWLKEELARLPLPLAVFATEDQTARRVEQVCIQLGISVPEQMAIMGVNNDPMECPYARVPLSSIDPDWHAVGWQAAATLDAVMAGKEVPALQLVPPKGVVERQSTSVLAVEDRRVADAVYYIWENKDADPSVDDVCDAVGVPRRTLAHLFKKYLSRGIKEEIARHRIRRAKALLRESDLAASAIAKELGFKNAYYMYRLFKQHTGMTTKEYRESLR